MQIFKRPAEPSDFSTAVAAAKKKVEDYFKGKRKKANTANEVAESAKSAKVDFEPKWSAFKSAFSEAQHGKCGYCEIKVIVGQDGDVEHFFPKGEIWQLDDNDPDSWGHEREWLASVEGRKRPVISDQGYWWRAYDWSNYLLSCAVCNQKWKLSFFPVQNTPRRLPPNRRGKERALLLNPYDEEIDPGLHLTFGPLGSIEALDKSVHGFETIRTCGLDRETLRDAREEKAEKAHELLIELDEAIKKSDREAESRVYRDFYRMGKESRDHSGMVRIIFEQGSKMKWADLVGLANP